MKKAKFPGENLSAYLTKILVMCFSYLSSQGNLFSQSNNKNNDNRKFYIADNSNNRSIGVSLLNNTIPEKLKYPLILLPTLPYLTLLENQLQAR